MSNLGYLRPQTSCAYLTAGKLYPVENISEITYKIFNEIGQTVIFWKNNCAQPFDYLPPDHGLGWVKYIKQNNCSLNLGDCFAIHSITDYFYIFSYGNQHARRVSRFGEHVGLYFEYIPPYQAEAPALQAPINEIEHECDTCGGVGTIDETLGGVAGSNPEAECPDCNGHGHWMQEVEDIAAYRDQVGIQETAMTFDQDDALRAVTHFLQAPVTQFKGSTLLAAQDANERSFRERDRY